MFEILIPVALLAAAVVTGRLPARRIYWLGNLAGNFVRFKPNFGFKLGPFKWSRLYGRSR